MYKKVWKRNPNKHYFVGMKANGSTITAIEYPDTSEKGAYIEQWHGTYLKKNPRWLNVVLASGKTIKSTEIVQELTDVV